MEVKSLFRLHRDLERVGPPTCVMTKHKIPVSASVNPSFYIPQLPCIPLTDANLKKIVKNCGQAAADAKEMGLDGIYLHGHEGYLLEQMTNPAFNRRQMGRYKDYEMFGLDIIREIRKRAGDSFPIMYRIDLSLALNETYQERMNEVSSLKRFKNGRTIKDTLHYMAKLVRAGVDLFDVDKLTPGIAVFGMSFLSLFSGMIIAKDRTSSFMMRLFASPMESGDFIAGYTLPLIPMAVAQILICFVTALFLGPFRQPEYSADCACLHTGSTAVYRDWPAVRQCVQ